jgi:hypothetical protein
MGTTLEVQIMEDLNMIMTRNASIDAELEQSHSPTQKAKPKSEQRGRKKK